MRPNCSQKSRFFVTAVKQWWCRDHHIIHTTHIRFLSIPQFGLSSFYICSKICIFCCLFTFSSGDVTAFLKICGIRRFRTHLLIKICVICVLCCGVAHIITHNTTQFTQQSIINEQYLIQSSVFRLVTDSRYLLLTKLNQSHLYLLYMVPVQF